MAKYEVTWASVCYWSQTVEANSPEQAIRLIHGTAENEEEQTRQDEAQSQRPDLNDETEYGETEAIMIEEAGK